MQKLQYDRTTAQQWVNESNIEETQNKNFGDKLSKLLSLKDEVMSAWNSNEPLQKISAFLSDLVKSTKEKIKNFEISKKEIEDTNKDVLKANSNSLNETK